MATFQSPKNTSVSQKGCRCHIKFENFSLFINIYIFYKVYEKYRFNGNLLSGSPAVIGLKRLPLRLPLTFSNGNLFYN